MVLEMVKPLGNGVNSMSVLLKPAHFMLLREPQSPEISPDGKKVLYSVEFFDEHGKRNQQIVLLSQSGERRVLGSLEHAHHPCWSSDGTLIACAVGPDDKGHSEIQVRDANTDEVSERYAIAGDVHAISWGCDGSRLAVEYLAANCDDEAPRVVRQLRYNFNSRGFIGSRRWQVCLVDRQTGVLRVLGDVNFHHFAPAWSPDGEYLALTTTRRPDWDLEWIWDVYAVDLRHDVWTKVTSSDGVALYPTWSPCGGSIAYLHNHSSSTGSTSDYHLCRAVKRNLGWQTECVTHEQDRGAALVYEPPVPGGGHPVFTPDGQRILWTINDEGLYCLQSVSVEGASAAISTISKDAGWPTISRDGQFMSWLQFRADGPPLVTLWDEVGQRVVRQWDDNTWLEELSLCREPRRFRFYSGEQTVEAWLWDLRPDHHEKSVLVQFHGGPHGTFGPYFSMTQQILASSGYCVAALNYRGSAGFGQYYADLVHANWGPQEGEDAIRLIEELADQGLIDSPRVGAFGASYGGFLTNWMVTKYPERIHRAVAISTVSHLLTSAFGIDHWESLSTDQGGSPWERSQYYQEHSPVMEAEKVQAPLLLLHGEDDMTCPLIEAEMMFVALRWQRKAVELVRYPRESHSFHRTGRLKTLIDVHERLLSWFGEL
jgi:dipeptidyl aminopeptidase/acylaminoacyl peptidase